jgi:hypothetical protein
VLPLTIAQGLAVTDKCFGPGACIPFNLFSCSVRNLSQTFDIGQGKFTDVNRTAYSGTMQLRNPVQMVPEPASAALLLLGSAVVGAAVWRRRPAAAQAPGSR